MGKTSSYASYAFPAISLEIHGISQVLFCILAVVDVVGPDDIFIVSMYQRPCW